MEQLSKNQVKRTGERPAFKGKWLEMKYIDFENNGKEIKNYEMVQRTTRKEGLEFDGVNVIPIIRYKDSTKPKQLLLIACYRPPVDKFCLEFPAGLMDDNDLEANALRELKEETGYIGTINNSQAFQNANKNIITNSDPWKSNEAGKYVMVDIDGDLEANQNPKQELENEENIFTLIFNIDHTLLEQILKAKNDHNLAITSKVYSFALGLAFQTLIN